MVRTLHIDIEGGWGGSSRSLFQLISRLDPGRVQPLVAHRQMGPNAERYDALAIPREHVADIASFAPRKAKSWKIFIATMPRLIKLGHAADRLAAIAKAHDAEVIHLNYEGLFLLAPLLKQRTGVPLVGHSRTLIPDNVWGRWMVNRLSKLVDHMFFISPQEEQRFRLLESGPAVPGEVLWNIANAPLPRDETQDHRDIVYLGNLDPTKGPDRLIDVASALEALNAPATTIKIYGHARSNPEFTAMMENRIKTENLGHRIELCGHTAEPEKVLSEALALVRPSRDNDPWGRDVIEATTAGVPVLASGSFDGVIEPDVNGYLFGDFDAQVVAEQIKRLLEYPGLAQRLGQAGREKGERLFDGSHQSARATAVFEGLAKSG